MPEQVANTADTESVAKTAPQLHSRSHSVFGVAQQQEHGPTPPVPVGERHCMHARLTSGDSRL